MAMVVTVLSANPKPISNVLFQAAVPKVNHDTEICVEVITVYMYSACCIICLLYGVDGSFCMQLDFTHSYYMCNH